jgi:hypothetical protein
MHRLNCYSVKLLTVGLCLGSIPPIVRHEGWDDALLMMSLAVMSGIAALGDYMDLAAVAKEKAKT